MDTLESAYNQHKSELAHGAKTGKLIEAFDQQPTMIGRTLDDMHALTDPQFAQAPGPVVDAQMNREGRTHRRQSYYLGYDDRDRILWFEVNVDAAGDEVLGENGWMAKR
ncbi:hypothetical protein H4S02_001365 [Coemansia sp. RSA 2611]|nr:hypothetical protein IWW54_002522 [Coemansia sp. RSA 2705]KAJ2391375.1 hypothetical protein H4S02_001365 [Coemansia sp. RSA 2611]